MDVLPTGCSHDLGGCSVYGVSVTSSGQVLQWLVDLRHQLERTDTGRTLYGLLMGGSMLGTASAGLVASSALVDQFHQPMGGGAFLVLMVATLWGTYAVANGLNELGRARLSADARYFTVGRMKLPREHTTVTYAAGRLALVHPDGTIVVEGAPESLAWFVEQVQPRRAITAGDVDDVPDALRAVQRTPRTERS